MLEDRRNRRVKGIAGAIQRELAQGLLAHPRRELFAKVTFTTVVVSPDLSVARVFYSVFDGVAVAEIDEAFRNESKYLRKMLATKLNLRKTPRLEFIYDQILTKAQKLSDLIDAAVASDETRIGQD